MDHQSTVQKLSDDMPTFLGDLYTNAEQTQGLQEGVEQAWNNGKQYLATTIQTEAFERTKVAKAEVMTCIHTGQSYA